MTLSMEIYTQLINKGRVLNQEIRQKLSSMPSYTELEMLKLEASLEEVNQTVDELSNLFLLISEHLRLLEIELQERLNKTGSSRD